MSTGLYTKSIISEDEHQEAMKGAVIPKTRTVNLLTAVLSKIKFEPQVFVDFVKILETEPSLTVQAYELVLCYQGGYILCNHPMWAMGFAPSYLHLKN